MSHADICPCKHNRMVCRGSCGECCTDLYGSAAAEEIVQRDGPAPESGSTTHLKWGETR